MLRTLVRGAVVLATVAAVGLVGAGSASAAPGDPPSIVSAGNVGFYGVSEGAGSNFTPGGLVEIDVYDGGLPGYPLIASTRVAATAPFFQCAMYYCAHYPGGEISWHLDIGLGSCFETLWVHAVDLGSLQGSNWVVGEHLCYFHGG